MKHLRWKFRKKRTKGSSKPVSSETTAALIMHYFPAYDLDKIGNLSYRLIALLTQEVSNVSEIFNPDLEAQEREEKEDAARALGCNNPEDL